MRGTVLGRIKATMNRMQMTRTTAVRLGLGAFGAAGIGYGLLSLPTQLHLAELVGLAAWLAAALLLHDGILVPMTTLTGHWLRRVTPGLTALSQALIRGALLLGAVLTLIVAALLMAQQAAGNPPVNATVLHDNYALKLGILWLALVVLTAAAVAAVEHHARRTRRQITRS